MKFLIFLQLALKVTTFVFVISTIFFLYIIYKGFLYTNNLSKKVNELGKGITFEKVEEFKAFLNTKYIPFYAANFVKAGYRLIEMDENIDAEIKKKIKVMALSKGILAD